MTLAYVKTETRGATDLLLSAFAKSLAENGARLSGVVQSNTACSDTDLCDMDVKVLPDGPVFRISQSLGTGSRGCRLDPAALEQAVAHVSPALTGGPGTTPDLLIVNKFGKHEADGRGFRPLIADALMAGIPVLTAVNGTNETAFQDFADGMADCLPATLPDLLDWFARVRASAGEPV